MSVSSSKITPVNKPHLQGACASGKTLFTTTPEPPKISVVQQAVVAPLQGVMPPPVSESNKPAETAHTTPILVAATQAGTNDCDLNTEEEPESYEQWCNRLLDMPTDSLTSDEEVLREAIEQMNIFVNNEEPYRADLIYACDSLKAMAGPNNSNLRTLKDQCADDWLLLLTSTIERFLVRVSELDSSQFEWHETTLRQIAKICYGVKACYELEYFDVNFSLEQSKPLVTAGRKITRKLIDQVSQRELIKSHDNIGDVLSLLAWIACGLHREFRSPQGHKTQLLAGCTNEPGKVSLTDIGKEIFSYFEGGFPDYANERQIGKLFAGIEMLLRHKVLIAGSKIKKNDISTERFEQAVLKWCRSPALSRPPMVASANPDLDEPVKLL